MEISGVELNELEIDKIGRWPLLIRIMILIGVFVVSLMVGYLMDLAEVWNNYSAMQSKRVDLEATFESAQHKVSNLEAYKEQVKVVEAELQKLTEQLPTTNEEAGLLEDISQQAITHGLQFVSIKPSAEQHQEFYIENPIELTVSGSYQGLGEFTSSISSMPRIVTLHDFTIQNVKAENEQALSGGEQTMKGPLVMTVTTKTYWTVPYWNLLEKGPRK